MNPKEFDIQNLKIGIITKDGFCELGPDIEDITLKSEENIEVTSLEDLAPVIFESNRSFECTFEVKGNINWRNVFYASNNWRRIHGLPMIRRWGKR